MDYATLVAAKTVDGSVRNWLNDSTVPSTTVLDMAENWIYRRLRVRQMIKTATGTITTSADTLTAPTDYIAPIRFALVGATHRELKHVQIHDLEDMFTYDEDGNRIESVPAHYAVDADNVCFDVPPDAGYPYRFRYFAQPAALSVSNTTNFLTSRAPRLVMAACCLVASEFKKDDEEKAWWAAIATDELGQLNREYDFEKSRGLDLAVRVE